MAIEMIDSLFKKTNVLFVCTGNICRSPVAQAVFEKKLMHAGLLNQDWIGVDSAGTSDHHVGQKPDSRSQHAAAFRGYSLIGQTARQIQRQDFEQYDMILAMDWVNLRVLQGMAPDEHRHKIELIMRYAQNADDAEVPDPYYQDQSAFSKVVDYLEDACGGLIEVVKRRLPQQIAA